MSTKHVRTTGDLLRFGVGLRIDDVGIALPGQGPSDLVNRTAGWSQLKGPLDNILFRRAIPQKGWDRASRRVLQTRSCCACIVMRASHPEKWATGE